MGNLKNFANFFWTKQAGKSKKSHASCRWWLNEFSHEVIVVMSAEGDSAATKLNHMIHAAKLSAKL